jgi:hypothetical protein
MATNFASHYIDSLESQTRYRLEQAARPALDNAAKAQSIATAMLAAIKDNRLEDAKQHALALRPLMQWLPEGE